MAMPIILIFSESQSYDEKKKKKVSYDTHIYSYKKDKYIEYKIRTQHRVCSWNNI